MQNLIDLVMKAIMFLLISMSLAGCSQIPEYIKPVDGFELNRYLGTWYEIARLEDLCGLSMKALMGYCGWTAAVKAHLRC